jgi:hypothetical protein
MRYYKKPFLFATNEEARKLAEANIRLDRDGRRTVDGDGSMMDIKLASPLERARLKSWLMFPFGYKNSERDIGRLRAELGLSTDDEVQRFAEEQRDGFRIAMLRSKFRTDGRTTKEAPSDAEQLILDCLAYNTLRERKNRIEQLGLLEKTLSQSLERIKTRLSAESPEAFIAQWKKALTDCKVEGDRRIFLQAVIPAIREERETDPLVSSFGNGLTTKFGKLIEDKMHQNPQELFDWLKKHEPEILKLWLRYDGDLARVKGFAKDARTEDLLANLRFEDGQAVAKRWKEMMDQFPAPTDRLDFQRLTKESLAVRCRHGAEKGLLEALEALGVNPARDAAPVDTSEVMDKIIKAANNAAGTSARHNIQGEFEQQDISMPDDRNRNRGQQKRWWTQGLGWGCCAPCCCGLPVALVGGLALKAVYSYYKGGLNVISGISGEVTGAYRWSRDTAGSIYRWASGGAPGVETPELTDPVARQQVRSFWEKVRGTATALGENGRAGAANDPGLRRGILVDARNAVRGEVAGNTLHPQAEAFIDRAIGRSGTATPPAEVVNALRTPASPIGPAELPPIRIELPLRLADVSRPVPVAAPGAALKIAFTVGNRTYTVEDQQAVKETLDKMRDAYRARLTELESLRNPSNTEREELTRLRRTAGDWGADRLDLRAQFLEREVARDPSKFEYRPGTRGRPGVGRFAIGASVLLLAIGSWAIPDTPTPRRSPTRARRD